MITYASDLAIDETRRYVDEGGPRPRGIEAVIGALERVEVHGLRAVDDYVANAAEALLQDFEVAAVTPHQTGRMR